MTKYSLLASKPMGHAKSLVKFLPSRSASLYFSNLWRKAYSLNCFGKGLLATLYVVSLLYLLYLTYLLRSLHATNCSSLHDTVNQPWKDDINFTGFDNATGTKDGRYLVPNWIHFIRWEDKPMSFIHMLCMLAAFKNQKPDRILIHGYSNASYMGKYWGFLATTPGFLEIAEWHHLEPPDTVFGQNLSEGWKRFHGSDIERIRTMNKYGGIYLDNDCYLVRSLNDFRRYEIAMNWDEGQFLASQVIIAHKDARFLREWLETYRDNYRKDLWYYNAGERPTTEVLYKRPELLHRVKVVFGADNKYGPKVWHGQWDGWRDMYIIHLLIRFSDGYASLSPEATYPVEFDEDNILKYPVALRDMANAVYPLKPY